MRVRDNIVSYAEVQFGLDPFVCQKSLGDFCNEYQLNGFTEASLAMWQTYSDLHKNILDALLT